jgi:hypothetical protein
VNVVIRKPVWAPVASSSVCVRYGVLERSCLESENEYGSCHLALARAGSLLPFPSHVLKVKRVATWCQLIEVVTSVGLSHFTTEVRVYED